MKHLKLYIRRGFRVLDLEVLCYCIVSWATLYLRYGSADMNMYKQIATLVLWLVFVPEGIWFWLSYASAKTVENVLLDMDDTLMPTPQSLVLAPIFAYMFMLGKR